ncbi:hypothetical protein E4T44_02280 [Aureobasidium sp. EXF-8845]|nr:hypothetical protein E4T44_02280 [Aureobasidium sp. EXF-8845]KAI4854844.1 hypothetical protein E4T45_03729 [Aureobasidium sp. EXF-8846]
MSTAVSTWVEQARQSIEKWTKDSIEKEEKHLVISALESLLHDRLSGAATATWMNEILAPRLISGLRAGVGWLWGVLAGATRPLGASHTQQLVDLLIAIKQLPDITNDAGYVVTYGGKVIWREMPDWGWVFFEHGLGMWLSLFTGEVYLDMNDKNFYAEWHAQAPGKLSATIFTATLMVQNEEFRSLASYAPCAFAEIISSFDDREMADEWKMYIPPATAWIMIGGEVLHDLCSKKVPSQWNQSAMFTPDRWQIWKDRFLALADQTDVDEHCQSLSREAAQEMERIEHKVRASSSIVE